MTWKSLPRPGVRLGILALGLASLWVGCGQEAPTFEHRPARRPLLIVGWDGATYRMLDPLLAAGRLPNVAKLLARGASARLESTVVPISSAAWVGIATGKAPGKSAVYDFFDSVPHSYDVDIVSSRTNQATPLWRTLARNGQRSLVFGMPLTYPPEPLPGTMVCGMLSPPDGDYTYPPELAAALRARGFVPDVGIWNDQAKRPSADRIEEQLELKRQILLEQLAHGQEDLTLVVFKCLDVLSHRRYDGSLDGPVARLYVELDRVLGDLVAAVGEDTNVMLVSDHGFNAYKKSFHLQPWLFEAGFATRGARAPEGGETLGSLARVRVDQHRLQIQALDLQHTRALADTCEGNFGGIRLNVAGREPSGCVPPEEVPALLDEITHALEAVRVEGVDGPLVRRVWRATELYPGPHVDKLPDLLFETHPDVVCRTDRARTWFVDASSETRVTPDHDRYGILVAAGPDFRALPGRDEARIFDVGPTALHLLGLPVYPDCDGEVLTRFLTGERDVQKRDEAAEPNRARWPRPPELTLPEDERHEQMEVLEKLGYAGHGEDEGEPRALAPLVALAPAQADFTWKLHRSLVALEPEANVCASPLSIWTVLAMLAEGADGTTAQELTTALLGREGRIDPSAVRDQRERLRELGNTTELAWADALWGEQSFQFRIETLAHLQAIFGADMGRVDFRGAPEAARRRINAWISDETHARIQELLPAGSIDGHTRLVLTNAVYLHARWEEPFDPESTRTGSFQRADGAAVEVPFLTDRRERRVRQARIEDEFPARAADQSPGGLTLLELPYRGGDLAFVFLVPDAAEDLTALEERLSGARVEAWLAQLAERRLRVEIPKLRITPSYDLVRPFQALGLRTVMDPDRADLSRFAREGNPEARELFLGGAFHQVFLELDEEGTEAAAATGAVVGVRTALPMVVRVDRPFVFLLRDTRSATVLFAGRIADPARH